MSNVGYYGTYTRLVSTAGRIWQRHLPQPTPLAIDDGDDGLVYL